MKHATRQPRLANILGSIGYFAVIVQWLWTLLTVGYPLIDTATRYTPSTPAEQPQSFALDLSPALALSFAIFVTVAVLGICLFTILFAPKTISKETAKVTHVAADKLIPIMTGHKKVTPKKRKRLTTRTIIGIKAMLCLLPLCITYALPAASPLDFTVTATAAWFFAIGPIGWFTLQYSIAYLQKHDLSRLR